MSRTYRNFQILTEDEFNRNPRLIKVYGTYKKYVAESKSDKMMRRLPSSEFRRIRVQEDRSKQNQSLKANFKHDADWDEVVLPVGKRRVHWEYF